jgi:hypothetical protein
MLSDLCKQNIAVYFFSLHKHYYFQTKMSIDQDKAMMDPCCSFNLDQKLSNDKLNEHGELTDAELKIFLGRLVDESSDGNEIRVSVFYVST